MAPLVHTGPGAGRRKKGEGEGSLGSLSTVCGCSAPPNRGFAYIGRLGLRPEYRSAVGNRRSTG